MQNNYARALVDLLEVGVDPDTLFSQLPEVLKKHGHEALHTKIVKAVNALYLRKKDNSRPIVSVAREKDTLALKKHIENTLHTLGATSMAYTTIIDDSLIGGYTVLYKNRAVDVSQKKSLLSVYNRITN